jgi:hypothetical protein
MALSVTEQSLFNNLSATLTMSRPETDRLNGYYEGNHRLEQLGLSIPDELRYFTVFLGWPRTTVDAVERRLDVQGFRMPNGVADKSLWDIWQYNNMDERQTFAHTDALALARSYVCVGTNDDDPEYPLITVESPKEMIAVRDPRTRRVTSALRMYGPLLPNGDATAGFALPGAQVQRATLYLPNQTRWLILDDGIWQDEFDPDVHNLGTPPVVPLVNRNRATRKFMSIVEGISEMADVIPISDSASRAVTNAQLAQETMAAPQRGVLGATKGDFVDKDGNVLDAWKAYFGSVWALSNPEAKTFQFDAADLSNFENIVNMYARLASGVSSLPVEYFGLNTQNPPSADGQRAGETRLIKNAERKQTTFGHGWESVQRLVLRFRDGEWNTDARGMETIWRDAGTPTVAQVTDAIVKRYQVGLIDWETAQEQLGESPATIDQMKTRRQADSAIALGFGVQAAANS